MHKHSLQRTSEVNGLYNTSLRNGFYNLNRLQVLSVR